MGQKIITITVDDITGKSGDGEVDIEHFVIGAEGQWFEIDLDVDSAAATLLRESKLLMERYGRKIKIQPKSRRAGVAAYKRELAQIRAWAVENGFEVTGRGRIPGKVLAAYREAHLR